MFGVILKKEILENLLGPKFLITLTISIILVVTSVYSGYRLYEAEMDWYNNAQSYNKSRLENLGSYYRLQEEGSKVLREPSRMSIFVKGVDSAIGRSALVSRDPDIPIQDSRFELNPIFAVFGELDLAFIVKFILSLFAFLFSFNAISGEKEAGTLKQVMSYPLSKASFILGKTIGGIVILLLTLILPVLLSLLLLMIGFNVTLSSEELLRLGMLMVSFSIYLVVFYLIGMVMSALTKQSSLSFLLCLFIWVISVAVIPKMAVEIAGQVSPAPSIDEIEAKRTAFERDYFEEMSTNVEQALNDLFAKGRPTQEDLRQTREQVETAARNRMENSLRKELDAYNRKRTVLLKTARTIARISPTSCLTFAANRIAGTDAESLGRFRRNLDIYQTSFLNHARLLIEDNPDSPGSGVNTSISVSEDDQGMSGYNVSVTAPTERLNLGNLPPYAMEREPLEITFASILNDLLIMSLKSIVLFLIAFVAFMRYDVR